MRCKIEIEGITESEILKKLSKGVLSFLPQDKHCLAMHQNESMRIGVKKVRIKSLA